MKELLEENMTKGYMRQSSSPEAAFCMFVKKADWGLQFCIDCQDSNSKRINNRYPLPLIGEALYHLAGARIYPKLDATGAYNLV
jgi:hypothetical protein